MNSKFRTPMGNRKDNDISDINDILDNKIFSGTIPAKNSLKIINIKNIHKSYY